MTARAGMFNLIQKLRELANADESEFTLGGATYWTDSQLQDKLDARRSDLYGEAVYPTGTFVNGESQYLDYYWRCGNVEEAESGSAAWLLQDSNGSAIGTGDYTIDYHARKISFPASTDGQTYMLTYRTFNLNQTAADVWEIKAGNVANRMDIATDNHDLKRSQLYAHYTAMAKKFRQAAGGQVKQMIRSDVNG